MVPVANLRQLVDSTASECVGSLGFTLNVEPTLYLGDSTMKFESILKSVAVAMTMTVALAGAGNAMADEAKKAHNVVMHVNDDNVAGWNQALNNATNMLKAFGKDKLNVEIVMNGKGLDMVKLDSVVASRLPDALAAGVELKACGATMKATNVTDKDLAPGVQVVPGGMVEIIKKQEAGWTYIKG